MTNDKPLIFDEILEEEEEDKILENEILENMTDFIQVVVDYFQWGK